MIKEIIAGQELLWAKKGMSKQAKSKYKTMVMPQTLKLLCLFTVRSPYT